MSNAPEDRIDFGGAMTWFRMISIIVLAIFVGSCGVYLLYNRIFLQ